MWVILLCSYIYSGGSIVFLIFPLVWSTAGSGNVMHDKEVSYVVCDVFSLLAKSRVYKHVMIYYKAGGSNTSLFISANYQCTKTYYKIWQIIFHRLLSLFGPKLRLSTTNFVSHVRAKRGQSNTISAVKSLVPQDARSINHNSTFPPRRMRGMRAGASPPRRPA